MDTQNLTQETAGGLMTKNVPVFFPEDKASNVLGRLGKEDWEEIKIIFITDKENHLLGFVSLPKLFALNKNDPLSKVMKDPPLTVSATAHQEKVVIEALKKDLTIVPVVDNQNKFLGAVTAEKIIDVLHAEHLEDFLRSSGIRGKGSRILDLVNDNLFSIIKARLPWLLVGLTVGLVATIITSHYEDSLKRTFALVFFIPVVAYMSDAIGTQTETIFIRSITLLKINYFSYILRELAVGVIIGSILGFLAGGFAYFISSDLSVGFVVGLSLLTAMSFATVLACLTPLVLRSLGKDPAIGSGPFTTALQDLISLTVYLTIASLLL